MIVTGRSYHRGFGASRALCEMSWLREALGEMLRAGYEFGIDIGFAVDDACWIAFE